MAGKVTEVAATEFKAKCLELMDRVSERRASYVITKRGRPVAQLVPVDPPKRKSVLGCMADETELVGDIDEPLYTDHEWQEFERQREEQWAAWDREWHEHGTISGKRTVGRPPHLAARRSPRRKDATRAKR